MARIKNSLKANYKDGFLKDFFLTTPYFKQSLWFLYKFVKRDCCQWRFWKILLCEMWVTWHYLSANHPGQYGHFLPTTTTSFMRSGCGWERRGNRATTLRRETVNTPPPPPPPTVLCSLAVAGCGMVIRHDSRKTRSNHQSFRVCWQD